MAVELIPLKGHGFSWLAICFKFGKYRLHSSPSAVQSLNVAKTSHRRSLLAVLLPERCPILLSSLVANE